MAESITSKETMGIRWLLWQHAFSVFVDAIGTVESWFLGETLEKFHNAYKALGKTTVTDGLLDAIGRVHEQLISFDSAVCNNIDLSFAPSTYMSVKVLDTEELSDSDIICDRDYSVACSMEWYLDLNPYI